ncbi:hypothetical protein ACFQ2B_10380 [Streptomyces stramineus]
MKTSHRPGARRCGAAALAAGALVLAACSSGGGGGGGDKSQGPGEDKTKSSNYSIGTKEDSTGPAPGVPGAKKGAPSPCSSATPSTTWTRGRSITPTSWPTSCSTTAP